MKLDSIAIEKEMENIHQQELFMLFVKSLNK